MIDKIKAVYENKSFMDFLKRSSIFLIVLFLEVLLLRLLINLGGIKLSLISNIIPDYRNLIKLGIIFIGCFLIFSGKKLLKIKPLEKLNYKYFALFFVVNLMFIFLFYKLNKYFIGNSAVVNQSPIFYTGIWLILGLIISLSLLFAFFDFKFILYLIRMKSTLISAVFIALWFFFSKYIKKYFIVSAVSAFLAKIVARIIYVLLKLFFDGSFYRLDNNGIPVLGIPNFVVKIVEPCSGIEGISLFLLLFTVLVLIEHNRINRNRVLLLYPLGVIGAFFINVFRTFFLFVAGHFVSAEFALGMFHSNIGWITFTIYFLIFIYFAYPWMRKKKDSEKP